MTIAYNWEDRVEIFPYLEKVTNVTTTAITANGNKVSIPNKILNGKLLLKLSVLNKENTEIVTLIHTTIINGKEHLLHKDSAYYLSTKKSQSANSGGGNSSVTDIYKIAKENGFKGNELEFVNAILADKDTDSWNELQDIPNNIGYIDSENQINNGNVYTKDQIEEKLRTKVAFPTRYATPAGSLLGLAGQQFLVGYEEELNTVPGQNEPHYNAVRYSLEDIGKNLANSNLKIPQGQIRELDVTGAKFRIKGLQNKSADPSVNLKLMQDAKGNIYVSDKEDIAFNFPNNFSATLTINHIYPYQVPDRPAFADDLKRVLEGYRSYQFTHITQSDWVLKTKENRGLSSQYLRNDDSVVLNGADKEFYDYPTEEEIVTLTAPNVVLPRDRDWILKVKCNIYDSYHGGKCRIGVAQGNTPVNIGIIGGRYSSTAIINNREIATGIEQRDNLFILIIKTGAIVSILVYSYGSVICNSQSVFSELGDYSPKVSLWLSGGFTGSMEYKIL